MRVRPAASSYKTSDYRGMIEEVCAKSLTVRITSAASAPEQEEGVKITLYQGLPKGEKLDLHKKQETKLKAPAWRPVQKGSGKKKGAAAPVY